MKTILKITSIILLIPWLAIGQPATWNSRGVGGGGALFFPSINPGNTQDIYISCDMSEYFHTTNQGASWSQSHFSKIQGGNYGKIVHTNDPNLLYGIDNTSINFSDATYPSKSTDGGQNWTHLSGNPDNTEKTYTIDVDYNNPNRIVISYYGSIHFSNNGGTSFTNIHTNLSSGAGNLVGGVFFDGNNIYIGTNDGLIVSTNGGGSFTTMAFAGIPATEKIISFAGARQENTTRLFCLTGDVNSVYVGLQGYEYYGEAKGVYSLDYGPGASWVSKGGNINFANTFPMYIGMATNNINVVYLAGSSALAYPLVLKTSNAGGLWNNTFLTSNNQNIITGWSGFQGDRAWSYGECALGFAVAPLDTNVAIFTDFGFAHMTTNGGTSWKQMYVSPADQNPANQPTPTGKAYHSVSLENTSCWQVFWSDSTHLMAAYSDIDGCRSTDGGLTWSFNFSGLPDNSSYRFVKNNANSTIYAATATVHDMYQSTRLTDATLDGGDGAVRFSTNQGATWSVMHDFNHCVVWVATDPTNNNRLYASVVHSNTAQGGIYVSNDIQNGAASTWTKLSNPPRVQGHPFNIKVLNDGKVLCSFSGRRTTSNTFTNSSGVFLYDPATATWADRSDAQMQYWTKDVVVDPNDAAQNTWYAGVYSHWGCGGCEYGGLYKTVNRGVNWTRISNSYRVGSCTFDPADPNKLYFSTETEGLWVSTNINAATPTFSLVNSYPFRQPERIFFDPYHPGQMWVSSFGNGMKVGQTNCNVEVAITGNEQVCKDDLTTYTATAIPNAVYSWNITGGSIISGQGTNQVTVVWDNGVAGQINVSVTVN